MKRALVCVWIVMNANAAGAFAKKEMVEHRVFGKEALEEAEKLSLSENRRKIRPGCRTCSPEENFYCRGGNLLHDHCCCDRRHREKLFFIPHICYVKLSATCEPVAADCEEYSRLYDCCCQALVANRWKKFSSEFAVNKAENKDSSKGESLVLKAIALLATLFSSKYTSSDSGEKSMQNSSGTFAYENPKSTGQRRFIAVIKSVLHII